MATYWKNIAEHDSRQTDRRPLIRLVSLVRLQSDDAGAFDVAVKESVAWLVRRSHAFVPTEAFDGEPFELTSEGAQPTTAVRSQINRKRAWAARIIDADKEVAQRSWVVEIVVAESDSTTTYDTRLTNVTRGSENPDFVASIPGVARQILTKLTCHDGCLQLLDTARKVESDDSPDYERFEQALFDKDRRLPIIALSRCDDGTTVLNATGLASRLCGVAHVFEIARPVSWKLTERYGRKFSAFNGAVRHYRTGITRHEIYPYEHPYFLLEQIGTAHRMMHLVVDLAIDTSLSIMASARPSIRFDDVRRAQMLQSDEPGVDSDHTANRIIDDFQRTLADERQAAEQLLDEAAVAANTYQRQIAKQSDELEKIKTWLTAMRRRRLLTTSPLLSYDDIEPWINEELAPHVIVLPKAIRETEKKANFQDIVLFQEALLLLRDYYVPMRTNPHNEELRTKFQLYCKSFPIEESKILKNLKDAENLDGRYYVTYKDRRWLCDRHLKYRPSDWNPVSSFRIYFFWDEIDQKVVIGHMPTHLNNWKSN